MSCISGSEHIERDLEKVELPDQIARKASDADALDEIRSGPETSSRVHLLDRRGTGFSL